MKLKIKKSISLILIIAMLLFTIASFTGSSEEITSDDRDGDGLKNIEEDKNNDNVTDKGETDPDNPDSDGDGLIDGKDDRPLKKDEILQYSKDGWDKEEASNSPINIFLFVFLLSFAVFSLLAGIFTAYFGAGKSRAIGGVLLVLGLIVILIWVYFGLIKSYPDDSLLGIVHWEAARTLDAIITVVGALIGAIVAIVLFLVAIMKS